MIRSATQVIWSSRLIAQCVIWEEANAQYTPRRRRDSTVEFSRVGVASASAVCIEFATSSRRLPTKIWKLNMLRIYFVELSRVELCRRCVRARRLSWPSLQFCSLYVTGAEKNWKLHGSWLTTGAFTPPTRRNSTSLSANCSDSSRLSPTSCEFNTHTQLNSTVELRRRRRCVLGLRDSDCHTGLHCKWVTKAVTQLSFKTMTNINEISKMRSCPVAVTQHSRPPST